MISTSSTSTAVPGADILLRLKLNPLIEQCVLDGRNMLNTFLVAHPNMEALRTALTGAGIAASGDDAAVCADPKVREFLLANLKKNNMVSPDWKGYEVARTLILDSEEWTTDNDMLTPSMKVKLRNLLKKHDEEIQAIG